MAVKQFTVASIVAVGLLAMSPLAHSETIKTRFGTLESANGYPTEETTKLLFDKIVGECPL